MLFSFSDYVSDVSEYNVGGNIERRVINHIQIPKSYKTYFSTNMKCPSCKTKIVKVFEDSDSMTLGKDFFTTWEIVECPECGWWKSYNHTLEEDDYIYEINSYHKEIVNYAIMKKFNESDKNLPLEILLNEIKKRPDVLYDIHYYKMEQLVKHVFENHY